MADSSNTFKVFFFNAKTSLHTTLQFRSEKNVHTFLQVSLCLRNSTHWKKLRIWTVSWNSHCKFLLKSLKLRLSTFRPQRAWKTKDAPKYKSSLRLQETSGYKFEFKSSEGKAACMRKSGDTLVCSFSRCEWTTESTDGGYRRNAAGESARQTTRTHTLIGLFVDSVCARTEALERPAHNVRPQCIHINTVQPSSHCCSSAYFGSLSVIVHTPAHTERFRIEFRC